MYLLYLLVLSVLLLVSIFPPLKSFSITWPGQSVEAGKLKTWLGRTAQEVSRS